MFFLGILTVIRGQLACHAPHNDRLLGPSAGDKEYLDISANKKNFPMGGVFHCI